MAKYKSFPGNNSSILIEVEEGSTGGGSGNFKDSLGMLQEVIRSFVDSVNKIPARKSQMSLKLLLDLKLWKMAVWLYRLTPLIVTLR